MIQPYINYEEELLVEEGEKGRRAGTYGYDQTPKRDNKHHREDEDHGPRSKFSVYTHVKNLREKYEKSVLTPSLGNPSLRTLTR